MQLAFHLHAQRNASRRRDVRLQSRSFARCNQSLRRSPNSNRLWLRLSAMISQYFMLCRAWLLFVDSMVELYRSFDAGEATSFWKRGSFRIGSNLESGRTRPGVSGTLKASALTYGIESSFSKAAIARSGSPICAATRARISIGAGPPNAAFSI